MFDAEKTKEEEEEEEAGGRRKRRKGSRRKEKWLNSYIRSKVTILSRKRISFPKFL